jgi:hypothetical protein
MFTKKIYKIFYKKKLKKIFLNFTGIASISVFLDNQTMFEQAINAYKH